MLISCLPTLPVMAPKSAPAWSQIPSDFFALVAKVSRITLASIAYLGYLISFGCWSSAYLFYLDQWHESMPPQSIVSNTTPIPLQSVALPAPPLSQPPIKPLTIEEREWRIRNGTEVITNKLRDQWERAQHQAMKESDKPFQYVRLNGILSTSHTEFVGPYTVGVCHLQGRRPTMEDEHVTASFDLLINGKSYPVQIFGIFDGHGGSSTAIYLKNHLANELHRTLCKYCPNKLTDEGIWNALKLTFVRLNQKCPHPTTGSTAIVTMILDGKLWTANVGDSRAILDTGVRLSEDAKPNNPYYRKGIETRGGKVIRSRINGILAMARAIGDRGVGAVSPRPKITMCPIPHGSQLILTCDGIFDVASTRQLANAVRNHPAVSVQQTATNIVYSAFASNSGDNLSALVIRL